MRAFRLPFHLLIFAVFAPGSTSACQVPVFRYALERWIPDDYRLESAGSVPGDPPANLSHSPAPGQNLTLRYPKTAGVREPFFTSPFSTEILASITDSPVRRDILRRILGGDSAVWLLVESGDKAKDDAAFTTLISALREAESDLELPEGIIGIEEARLRDVSPEEEENVLVSTIPLQIKFSALRISRENPEEAVFLSLLLHMEDDLGDYGSEPIAFALFGRGRVLPPLVAGGITTSNILGDCGYLCGACSCQVKRENPGIDALFTADWDAALEGGAVVIDKILPPLTGAGDVVAPGDPRGDTISPTPPPQAPAAELADSAGASTFRFSLPIAIGIAIAVILLGSIRILKRS